MFLSSRDGLVRLSASIQTLESLARFLNDSQLGLPVIDKTGITGDISYGYAAMSRIYLAFGLPLLFLPVTTASFEGIPPDKTNQASALMNVARNFGGSMGVALFAASWNSRSSAARWARWSEKK